MYYVTLFYKGKTEYLPVYDSVAVINKESEDWEDYTLDMEDSSDVCTVIICTEGDDEHTFYLYKREYYQVERG